MPLVRCTGRLSRASNSRGTRSLASMLAPSLEGLRSAESINQRGLRELRCSLHVMISSDKDVEAILLVLLIQL